MSRSHHRAAAGLLPLALALAPASAFAELIPGVDINGKVGYWGAAPTGTVQNGQNDIDLEDDLNFERNDSTLLELAFEHPVPLIPNVRMRHVELSDEANGTLNRQIEFAGETYSASEDVRSSYDFKMTDATFYYSPLDNWVSLDFGLTARHVDASAEIERRSDGSGGSTDVSLIVPMGHLALRLDAPLTGVYAAGEVNAISANDAHLRDVRAVVGWQPGDLVAFEAGYQELSIEFDEADLSADLDFAGPFASVSLRF